MIKLQPVPYILCWLVCFTLFTLLGARSSLQSLVSTRGQYRIVQHRAVPTLEQQSALRRKSCPASTSNSTAGSRRYLIDKGDLPERISFSATNNSKDEPSSSSGNNGPPLVVIDGSNVAFAYREGDGRWFAQGPLLALKVGGWVGGCFPFFCRHRRIFVFVCSLCADVLDSF